MKYKLLVADPPWLYRNKNTGGSMKSGSAAKYPTLTTDEICKLPISCVCDRDCVLFLWVTNPMLEDGLRVMREWGFKYKTMVTWRKIMSWGMGYWFRGQTEHCLLGVKGKVKAFRIQKANFIQSKVRKHSQKPEEFFELIKDVELKPRLEIFATSKREGWDAAGFDIDGLDIKESLRRLTNEDPLIDKFDLLI